VLALTVSVSRSVVVLRHFRREGYTYGEMVRITLGAYGFDVDDGQEVGA
jgi:hypothetical protein